MNKPIRALLLAAVFGTRLRPITLLTPKCLVEIAGEPLLGHWLQKLEKAGCEATLINTHYLSEQVVDYLKGWRGQTMTISVVHEEKLLGTAGTLLANETFFKGATGLLIHADNVMADELAEFLYAHENRAEDCLLTMLTFVTDTPSTCGIVETDETGRLLNFHEKVDNPPGNEANGAIYAFDQNLLDQIKKSGSLPNDFSTDVLPTLLGKIQTWKTNQAYIDIGHPIALEKAQIIWRQKHHEP